MAKVIGIDLGTTNSVAAVVQGGQPVVIPTAHETVEMRSGNVSRAQVYCALFIIASPTQKHPSMSCLKKSNGRVQGASTRPIDPEEIHYGI